MSRKGFTLIELLVVIAIIALLLSILMPSLRHAKQQATAVVCMSNEKQLAAAWFMYAGENEDKIVDGAPEWVIGIPDGNMSFNNGVLVADGSGDETTACFVSVPQDITGAQRNTSLEDKIRGFKKGGLWDYYEDYKLMNCPSDKRYRHPPVQGGPPNLGGYRSYSIGAVYSLIGRYYAITTGEFEEVVTKSTMITQPSTKMVWIEEADGRGHNQNTWNMFLNSDRWWDPFAIWHNGSSTFGFADGHADRHKWVEEETLRMAREQDPDPTDCPGSVDYAWFRKTYIPR